MSDFYGIKPGTIPEFAEVGGGAFMSVQSLPEHTVRHMLMFMHKLHGMHDTDALAFEVCVRHVASMIEDQRRRRGRLTLEEIRPRDIGTLEPDKSPWRAAPMVPSVPSGSSVEQDS